MALEHIGFYTLSDRRAAGASAKSRLERCEVLLGARCNFKCGYCRGVGGPDADLKTVLQTLKLWARDGLRAVRFSGGEPTLHRGLPLFVWEAARLGIERVAVSTNGSAPLKKYRDLLDLGANDFSVSLDACCAADGDAIAGAPGSWQRVVDAIKFLAERTYTTVGVVLTEANAARVGEIIEFADSLGVSDVRVIPAAQRGARLEVGEIRADLLAKYPILRYRVENIRRGRPVRGLSAGDPRRCALVLDDMAVAGQDHYPCIIYLREGGAPIGRVGPSARAERAEWSAGHDCRADPICAANCLDVCVDYNRRWDEFHGRFESQTLRYAAGVE